MVTKLRSLVLLTPMLVCTGRVTAEPLHEVPRPVISVAELPLEVVSELPPEEEQEVEPELATRQHFVQQRVERASATDSIEGGAAYLVSTQAEIDAAVDKFLGFEDTAGPVGTVNEGSNTGTDRAKKRAIARARKKARQQKKRDRASATTAPDKDEDGLVDASQGGLDAAVGLDAEIKRKGFPVYYAKRLPAGTIYAEGSRTYHVRDPDKNVYPAYRMVLALELNGLNYFGLQGIKGWDDPPILEAPHDDITMDGRDFRVYPEGDRVRLVAWSEGGNTYWISNSLLLTLTNEQMLGMARSTRAFTPGN